jgi:hypothetical protein
VKNLHVLIGSLFVPLAATLYGCGGECVQPPCALPTAIRVTVTSSSTGTPIDDAVLLVGGYPVIHRGPGSYVVQGAGGTYDVTVSAPGFEPFHRTVTVPGTGSGCGCGGVTTQDLDVALIPLTP